MSYEYPINLDSKQLAGLDTEFSDIGHPINNTDGSLLVRVRANGFSFVDGNTKKHLASITSTKGGLTLLRRYHECLYSYLEGEYCVPIISDGAKARLDELWALEQDQEPDL